MADLTKNVVQADWHSTANSSHHNLNHESQPLKVPQNDSDTQPKRHRHALYLLIAYIPLITIPWVLTCVLARRPYTVASFFIQTGLSQSDVTKISGWTTAINVLNSIASVVTIPVISALVAQAAAVYTQKNKDNDRFDLGHLLALSDRGWLNPVTLTQSTTWLRRGSTSVRNFLYFAIVVILIGKYYFKRYITGTDICQALYKHHFTGCWSRQRPFWYQHVATQLSCEERFLRTHAKPAARTMARLLNQSDGTLNPKR